jgi:hypothetical protein
MGGRGGSSPGLLTLLVLTSTNDMSAPRSVSHALSLCRTSRSERLPGASAWLGAASMLAAQPSKEVSLGVPRGCCCRSVGWARATTPAPAARPPAAVPVIQVRPPLAASCWCCWC